jgi:transcriptional regulator with GAF, ATPase, and Fis domain
MVWQFHDGAKAQDWKTILSCLSAAGAPTEPLTHDPPRGTGIMSVCNVTDRELELVQRLSRGGTNRVLVLLPHILNADACWQILTAGAADVVAWNPELADTIAARIARWRDVDEIVASPLVAHNLIGHSPVWVRLLRQVTEASCFTTAPILLLGESGTGKELLARLIHTLDRREAKKSLVVVDCATIVPELSGSEFFGHERGAFTNALQARDGAFALADGGTLFLDEVGELPPVLQSQLLRVVQEKTYKRIGSNRWQQTQFRLVCATNRNLREEVESNVFRRDLYHRLASWTFEVPPLRERGDDTLLLAEHLLRDLVPDYAGLDDSVRRYLITRSYDGNVRELRQLVARIAARHVGLGPISAGDIPEDERPKGNQTVVISNLEDAVRALVLRGVGLREISREAANLAVQVALLQSQGNLQKAARALGVTDRALQIRSARATASNFDRADKRVSGFLN